MHKDDKLKITPSALDKATKSSVPLRKGPPPKPAMPPELASGDQLDPRVTEVDNERLGRMPPPVAMAAQAAAAAATKQVTSPIDASPITDDDVSGIEPVTAGESPATGGTTETTAEGDPLKGICRYCGHDNNKEDVPECTSEDKVMFLAHLNGLDFLKEYEILNGNMRVTFRRLTVRELDACAAHCMNLVRNEKIAPTRDDYEESYLRCRLYLQLRKLAGAAVGDKIIELPEGLSKAANPEAKSVFQGKDGQDATIEDVTNYMLDKHIKNETMQRILMQSLREFNRLVGYMEANASNTSFWRETP